MTIVKASAIVMLSLAIFAACNREVHGASDYIKACESEENGFSISKTKDQINYSLRYRPLDYYLAKALLRDPNSNPDSIKRVLHESMGNALYFIYSVRPAKGLATDFQILKEMEGGLRTMEKSQSGIMDRVFLVDVSADTIPCSNVLLIPDGMNHLGYDLLIGFPSNHPDRLNGYQQIVLRDLGVHSERVDFDLTRLRPTIRFAFGKEG